jgi:hypothetical protein
LREMRVAAIMTALVAGLVLLAAPAAAHRAVSVPAEKSGASSKEQVVPAKQDQAPRICLFSERGKVVTPSKGARAAKQRAADRKDGAPARKRAGERVCDSDKMPAHRASQG